jgi:hypothetical protein
VKVSRQHAYAEDLRLITPDCATMDEMDTCIGKLIAERCHQVFLLPP